MIEGLLLKNTKYGTKGYVVIRIKIQSTIGKKGIRHESIQKLEKKTHDNWSTVNDRESKTQ